MTIELISLPGNNVIIISME